MDKSSLQRIDYVYKLLFIVGIIITVLIIASDIFVPLLLAGFIAFGLLPLVKLFERWKFSRVWAIICTLFVATAMLGGLFYLVILQVIDLATNLKGIEQKFNAFLNSSREYVSATFNIDTKEQNAYLQKGLDNVGAEVSGIVASFSGMLAIIIQIPLYVFLLLLYHTSFKLFLLRYFPISTSSEKSDNWLQKVKTVMQGYISGLGLVILILAILNTTGLLVLGIDYAIFFGVFAAFLTVIPYIGNFIGAFLPMLMALITKDSAWYAVGVLGVFLFVQFLEGNLITPKIMGSKVSINALAAIVALLIGGKILGIAGMIISIPCMGILKVILSYSQHLRPFTLLITETDKKGQPLENSKE